MALCLGVGITAAAPSMAVSNGLHQQSFSCTGGGTTKSITITYMVYGIGSSSANQVFMKSYTWHTDPNASLDRLSIYIDSDGDGDHDAWLWSAGGAAATQNDVEPESGYHSLADSVNEADFDNGVNPGIRFQTYGGVGDSANACYQDKTMLD